MWHSQASSALLAFRPNAIACRHNAVSNHWSSEVMHPSTGLDEPRTRLRLELQIGRLRKNFGLHLKWGDQVLLKRNRRQDMVAISFTCDKVAAH